MKLIVDIPPDQAWLLRFYEEKVKIRKMLGEESTVENEMRIAIEQYALNCINYKPLDHLQTIFDDSNSMD